MVSIAPCAPPPPPAPPTTCATPRTQMKGSVRKTWRAWPQSLITIGWLVLPLWEPA